MFFDLQFHKAPHWRIQTRAKGSYPPKLMTVWRKAVRVAIVVTQYFDVGND